MQSILMPASDPASPGSRMLVIELWGLGDLALALPFLRSATEHARVTLLAKPPAATLVRRFCPAVELIPLLAPWTAHQGKYRLHRWSWPDIHGVIAQLRRHHFAAAVSARCDPRDHLLMALAAAGVRAGFPRAGSSALLTERLSPTGPHRADHWAALASHFGWSLRPVPPAATSPSRHLVIHCGAGHPIRVWPRPHYEAMADRLRNLGWTVTLLDDTLRDLDRLLDILATADRFIGNDSGPGHLAAMLGVPTFTIFGPQLPALFAPQHPRAAWLEGGPCPHRPCFDHCRFPHPICMETHTPDVVWSRLTAWLNAN